MFEYIKGVINSTMSIKQQNSSKNQKEKYNEKKFRYIIEEIRLLKSVPRGH
jgi:hypothetical protein